MATLYEVEMYGAFRGKPVINQLGFASDIDDVATTSAFALAQALGFNPSDTSEALPGSPLDAFLAIQPNDYQMNELFVRNLFSVIDFITQPVAGAGWAGQVAPAVGTKLTRFTAMKFRTNRIRTDIKRGTLALRGASETGIQDGENWDSAILGGMQALCDELNAPPSFTVGEITTQYRPAVFSKRRYQTRVGTETEGPRWAYEYYDTEEQQLEHTAIGVTWAPVQRIRHQDTWAKS